MSIYYAVVEGDPLDSGGNSRVIGGADHSTIEGPDGRSRRQAYLGHEAWCSVCQSFGVIVADAGISEYLRGWDTRLNAFEAVGGDIVICKCERHPRIMSVYACSCTYVDSGGASAAASVTSSPRSSTSIATFDELVRTVGRGASKGYPYFIETPDGRTHAGRLDSGSHLPRIYTDSRDDYIVHWGDEVLAKQNGL